MDQPIQVAERHFTHPVRQIMLMLIVLALTGFGGFLALPRVLPVFQANPYLNGFIGLVFVIGVLACFWQLRQLTTSVRWIDEFIQTPTTDAAAPSLLAPLATLMRSRGGSRMQIAATSTRSILDSVATRIDEAREITRYIVNMLIFLGLLGTFYGLATTVPAVVDTIRSLAPQNGEGGVEVFNRLMTGLEAQLGGMGVAFASSLLGLAGSLVVGLLELLASHGQNRFYRELEEWLSTITRLGVASGDGDSTSDVGILAGVFDHMADQMEALQQMIARTDATNAQLDTQLGTLVQGIETLTDRVSNSSSASDALERVADGQDRLVEALQNSGAGDAGMDAESRMRLRSIDVQMLRILEEISAGRQESMGELRTDLAALNRTLAQLTPRVTPKKPNDGTKS